jgi:GTP cyclohydrolase I
MIERTIPAYTKSDRIPTGMRLILMGLQDRFGLVLDANFADTPERVSRMYDELFSGLRDTEKQVTEVLKSSFPAGYNQMIVTKDIEVFSMCPHHFLPVHYSVAIAYIPSPMGEVLGLSKLARLVEILAKRPVLQEQLTEEIAVNLMRLRGCMGTACVVKGRHYCMIMRGVKQSEATTITSSLKGVFFDEPMARQEFMGLLK